MEINTKFNIGDFVRVIDEPERIFSVKGIEIYVCGDVVSIYYRNGDTYSDGCGNEIHCALRENKLVKVKITDEI